MKNSIRWFVIRVLHVVTGKYYIKNDMYGNNPLIGYEEGNCKIAKFIEEDKPFALCRFGFVEMRLMISAQRDRVWKTNSFFFDKKMRGTFDEEDGIPYAGILQYDVMMQQACEEADLLGVWQNLAMGDYYTTMIKGVAQKTIVDATCVEPYLAKEPWTKALEGKRVLVVSPFSELIKAQYQNNREHLFENHNILPNFTLLTVDAIWYSIAGKDSRFSTWFEAYEYLCEECMKQEFDIALLGCGPFGFPLATYIKSQGCKAIQMGGAIQILFGIQGKRWDAIEAIAGLYNEYWVRPSKDTKPVKSDILDNNCYW